MRKVGLDFADLRMAVLVQRVVPAAYAFVIHTENPSTGAADEIYAEVVKGLGESIVSGMVPGTALSFIARKTSLDSPEVCMRLCCTCRAFLHSHIPAMLGKLIRLYREPIKICTATVTQSFGLTRSHPPRHAWLCR